MADVNDPSRALTERFLNRIAEDPSFRQGLLDDPKSALETAGFTAEMRNLRAASGSEVSGYMASEGICDYWKSFTCLLHISG